MSDLISRQDAIDAIEAEEANEFGRYVEYNVAFNDGLRSAIFAIEDLPSAQKKGEWLEGTSRQQCSACKYRGFKAWNFCPHCGADMRGDKDE